MLLKNAEEDEIKVLEDTKPKKPIMNLPTDNPGEKEAAAAPAIRQLPAAAPWMLHEFLNGNMDEKALDQELGRRFPNMPVMSNAHFRTGDTAGRYGIATLSTQDNAAALIVDVDRSTRVTQFSFTLRSMLSLRYNFAALTAMDRSRWLENVRLKDTHLAFLWSQQRWQGDYLLCVTHKYHTTIFAFSALHFESATRLTGDVSTKLLDWLDDYWKVEPGEKPTPLPTW